MVHCQINLVRYKNAPKRAAKWTTAVNKIGIHSDQSSVRSWPVQPIKELSSVAGRCAGMGCALIRQLANGIIGLHKQGQVV